MPATKTKKTTAKKKQLKAGNKKPVNKWVILGGIAAIAVIGAVVIRFSSASNLTFLKGVDQMIYRDDLSSTPYKTKSFYQGIYRYAGVGSGVVSTLLSKEDLRSSNFVCAKVLNRSKYKTKVWVTHRAPNLFEYNASLPILKPGEIKDVCVSVASKHKVGSWITVYGDRSGLGVRGFYGLKK